MTMLEISPLYCHNVPALFNLYMNPRCTKSGSQAHTKKVWKQFKSPLMLDRLAVGRLATSRLMCVLACCISSSVSWVTLLFLRLYSLLDDVFGLFCKGVVYPDGKTVLYFLFGVTTVFFVIQFYWQVLNHNLVYQTQC